MPGLLWTEMKSLTRHHAATLTIHDVPTAVGVYVWFMDGSPVYSGRAVGANGLRDRVWKNHMAAGPDLSRSSFRRNVCEFLGIADTSITRLRPTKLTPEDVVPVNAWIRECEVAWREFDIGSRNADVEAAKTYELRLHREWLPPLSKVCCHGLEVLDEFPATRPRPSPRQRRRATHRRFHHDIVGVGVDDVPDVAPTERCKQVLDELDVGTKPHSRLLKVNRHVKHAEATPERKRQNGTGEARRNQRRSLDKRRGVLVFSRKTRNGPEVKHLRATSSCSPGEGYLFLFFFWLWVGMPIREWAAAFLSSASLTYWPWFL